MKLSWDARTSRADVTMSPSVYHLSKRWDCPLDRQSRRNSCPPRGGPSRCLISVLRIVLLGKSVPCLCCIAYRSSHSVSAVLLMEISGLVVRCTTYYHRGIATSSCILALEDGVCTVPNARASFKYPIVPAVSLTCVLHLRRLELVSPAAYGDTCTSCVLTVACHPTRIK